MYFPYMDLFDEHFHCMEIKLAKYKKNITISHFDFAYSDSTTCFWE